MDKVSKILAGMVLLTATSQLHGQGYVYVYDQESASAPLKVNYDTFDLYKMAYFQSFTPTLTSIEFVQLELSDDGDTSTAGGKFGVSIFSGTAADPVYLGSSDILVLPAGFNNDGLVYSGIATFTFSTPITLVPGETYSLVPVMITGDDVWSVANTGGNTYPNGSLYGFNNDLWFREGVLSTPEPSDCALIAVGGLLLAGIHHGACNLIKSTEKPI